MIQVVLLLLLVMGGAEFWDESYVYDGPYQVSKAGDTRTTPDALRGVRGNIKKLLAGRDNLPKELTDPPQIPISEEYESTRFRKHFVGSDPSDLKPLPTPARTKVSVGSRQQAEAAYAAITQISKAALKPSRSIFTASKLKDVHSVKQTMDALIGAGTAHSSSSIRVKPNVSYLSIMPEFPGPPVRRRSRNNSNTTNNAATNTATDDTTNNAATNTATDDTTTNAATNNATTPNDTTTNDSTNTDTTTDDTTTNATTTATTVVITTTASKCTDSEGYRIRCPTTRRPMRTRSKSTVSTKSTASMELTTTTSPPNTTSTIFYDEDTTSTLTTTELPDIDKLLHILDNLTYIYDTDLVERFNQSLREEGYPYCPTTTITPSTVTQTPTLHPHDNFTGALVSKCFVCGLEVPGIPESSHCADAFASDFFPTAPVDFTSRKYMDHYRKHCLYYNINSWYINGTKDKYMWGRWTGGCSVRWIDLSGVYTQRSCRNKQHPSLGKNFASKRMAKLELALIRETNACIISPQASLVPFSRGVSLYARFHACVCTGSYCNQAERLTPLSVLQMVLFAIAHRIRVFCGGDLF